MSDPTVTSTPTEPHQDARVCPFCPDGHPPFDSHPWAVWLSGVRDEDGKHVALTVQRADGGHVAESLTKGTRVIVTGRLTQRSYETREGEKRTVVELQVDEVGPSLRYASAKVTRAQRSGCGGGAAEPDPWGGDGTPAF